MALFFPSGNPGPIQSLTVLAAACREPLTRSAARAQSFFERMYMGSSTGLYARAVDNFVRSLAAYAVVTYILQVSGRLD